MKKNIKYYFAAGIIALTAVSCTDLDVTPESQYTDYPTSEIAQEAMMADVYFHLRGALGRRYMESQALSSDEWCAISFDGDYTDGGVYAHTHLHNFYNTDACLDSYESILQGIAKANNIIEQVGGIVSAPIATAPARAMRAYYTWLLMDSYGDAPILEGTVQEGEAVDRSPRKEVAEWIEKELLEIIPLLTEDNNEKTYGKPNKWMAEALLVKLYINWPVYTASDVTAYDAASYSNPHLDDIVKYCDEIIESGEFSLDGGTEGYPNPYRAKFFPNNGPQIKDFIYAMPYDAITQQGFQYCRPRIWRQGRNDGKGGPGYFGSDIGNSSGGNFSISPEMSDILMKLSSDDRQENILAGQIYMFSPEVPYEKTTTPYKYKDEPIVLSKNIELKQYGDEMFNTGKDVHGWSQGYKSVKWFVTREDYTNGRNQSNDLPIFRYADILLTKAEAILRGASATRGDTPMSLFNEIRKFVHAPQISSNPTLPELLEERGREFFDENWRRNDMIRFGTFENEYGFHKRDYPTARFDKECRVFPIPQGVLEKNTNWKQNPGY